VNLASDTIRLMSGVKPYWVPVDVPYRAWKECRANKAMGQIIRWKGKNDFDSTELAWNRLVPAGDQATG
jgi:secreted PhoX family phosphatase